MVVRNQEARDALETYFKTFDITKFPGKNVPTACLCLKAVARALGENDLPTNLVRKVLEGVVGRLDIVPYIRTFVQYDGTFWLARLRSDARRVREPDRRVRPQK
jgi:hypothetical protein